MDHILQWAWDRHGARYSWVWMAIAYMAALPIYLTWSFVVMAAEHSTHYLLGSMVASVAFLAMTYAVILPGRGVWGTVQQWSAGSGIDRVETLEATYAYSRRTTVRCLAVTSVGASLLFVILGGIAGATGLRLAQYALLGCVAGFASHLVGVHTMAGVPMRPVRIALIGGSGIGDSLPRSRPIFATWTNLSTLASALSFAIAGSMLTTVLDNTVRAPLSWLLIGFVLTLVFGVPLTVGAAFAPSLQPIKDLAAGTNRVAAGNFSQRLPVVQDDDLGALAASFNRMQTGLAERQRLSTAFGAYVDPFLARRLLEQGDNVFTGERRQVTMMFVDIRDFTPFAEANTAEDTVARLNALFEIVVPAVVDAGGHVNKFLGDGALAVFGAPNDLHDHGGAAVRAALQIYRLVDEVFGGSLRIGMGINTGPVIAGTIGGGSKLEFTLIGDAVNVASRVEQLTKLAGVPILLTQDTVDILIAVPPGLADMGSHALKGKSSTVHVFGLSPATA